MAATRYELKSETSEQSGINRAVRPVSRQFGRLGFPWRNGGKSTLACETKIYNSIHEIEPGTWDEIVGINGLVRSHAYLAAIEAASVNDCKYFYPVISDDCGHAIAQACVYTITTDFAQLLPPPLAWLSGIVRRLWPGFLNVKITECASPLTASHSISIVTGADRQQLIKKIAVAVEEIAKSQGSNLVVVRDFLTEDRPDFDTLLEQGYNLVSNMPLARIRVRWRSYDEYLANMRSRYRKDVKRRLNRAQRLGQKVSVVRNFGGQAQLWVEQVRTVYEKTKGFKREVLSCGYYEQMDRCLNDKSVLVAAMRDGRFVAHGMVLYDDTDTIATYFGRDQGPASQQWFHLVNEVVRIGIERKSTYINLGLGSYDAKANIGADMEPLFVYSKSTISFVNWLMKLFRGTMEHPIKEPKRVFHD